eukprot:gene5225-5882_t
MPDGDNPMTSSTTDDVIATVTGSVNDETLIMEDKDTGFDLISLIDMKKAANPKKGRRSGGARQKQGATDAKEARPKTSQTVTFV